MNRVKNGIDQCEYVTTSTWYTEYYRASIITHVWQHEWAQGKSTSCVARGGARRRFLDGEDVGFEDRVEPLVVR